MCKRIAVTSFSEARVKCVTTTPGETEWQTVVNRIEHRIGRGDDWHGHLDDDEVVVRASTHTDT
jgi:hypothetical protein